MRVNHFLTSTLAATAMLVASCATPKLAQNNSADDVYNTMAQARVYKYSPPVQTAQIDTAGYRASDQNYDMDYASRIDRFYYGSPNRVYFDDYYNYYGYNSWYNPYNPYSWSLGFNYSWGFNRWYNPYSSWALYGSPYYWNTWGPYSYYNPWYGGGYYGGGYYGGGYWGNGWGGSVIVKNNENYRPRPNRSAENGIGARPNGSMIDRSSRTGGNTAVVGRTGSRPESYNPTTNGTSSRGNNTTRDSRPSRTGSSNNGDSRPTRTSESSRPSYTPPPSSSSSGSSSGSSGSSGSSSSGSSRPSRGGGR